MTRMRDYALSAFALIVALGALGLFASVGLALIGMFALLGLIGVATARCATKFNRKSGTTNGLSHP
ncbi:MAG: hypothetical protein AAGD13_24105 [Pseudomonadota bacterium]